MFSFRHASRRDMILILVGASVVHILSVYTGNKIRIDTVADGLDFVPPHVGGIAATTILHHAPGYTLFQNLYMSNGTLHIVSPNPSSFPPIRHIISTSLPATSSPENIALREPTPQIMDFLDLDKADTRWGRGRGVFSVKGNTVLFNDPDQFLGHYYHFVAELWFGVQVFWDGAFGRREEERIPKWGGMDLGDWNWNAYPISSQVDHPAFYEQCPSTSSPPINRAIFMHTSSSGWRDTPGFNAYFLRAAFPSMSIEHEEDWEDRATTDQKAFHFPLVLLVDRSAAFRDDMTGSHTQRTAAQAWEYMRNTGRLRGEKVGGWWHCLRKEVWRFAGVEEDGVEGKAALAGGTLPKPNKILITYISRQSGSRRKLTTDSHDGLVQVLKEFVGVWNAERREREERNQRRERNQHENTTVEREKRHREVKDIEMELIVMEAEKLTKDEQIQVISRTTILLGPHGNGLTHLVFMPPTQYSTIIEIFYPGGFAHDYHWTSRALGMRWVGVWNDSSFTYPNEPNVDYPEGFQEDYIPVHGKTVVNVIEDVFRR
ncbi:hypothetical protein J3R30DRAFT_103991 [Lentinula aciculospora]|uniref:Glycosyltransferase 61 catalytic domain-containing protein n=1 Tax=Lentinula aciculospora TaxID=153920 RepID=A0A9W9DY53_9AGAR|nr:hypothetical protein J3R30DRAFT_103991 [Lentinula aciculospora]